MLKRGKGMATIMFGFGYGEGFPDHSIAEITLNEDKILVRTAAADVGQGIQTVVTQIAAEVLKVRPEQIEIVPGDTHITQNSGSTSATRQTFFTGSAVKKAAEDFLGNLYHYASQIFTTNHPEMGVKDGKVFPHEAPEEEMTFWELADKLEQEGIELKGRGTFFPKTYKPDRITGESEKVYVAYTFLTQVIELTVDTATGEVSVDKVHSALDVGKAINPQGVEGQIEGGTVQGIGMALMEEQVIENGFTLNADMSRYLVPTSLDSPEFNSILIEREDTEGPYGAKGIGEPVTIAAAPAVANAIFDAVGVRICDLPITPEKIKEALRKED
ncbi:MAG: xanthine dehydrogenase family protein molybdopterin-binding subunit [Bacillota bacterium]